MLNPPNIVTIITILLIQFVLFTIFVGIALTALSIGGAFILSGIIEVIFLLFAGGVIFDMIKARKIK